MNYFNFSDLDRVNFAELGFKPDPQNFLTMKPESLFKISL
jgi:hypothetical protein